MNPNDKPRFSNAMMANALVFGRELSDETIAIYWAVLRDQDIDDISRAFLQHLKTSRFFPTPAELLALIPGGAGAHHLGADEAWTIALASFDEAATVVWTAEIAQARAIASDLFAMGDAIGARMAFRTAYERLVVSAPTPVWSVCAGWDDQRRLSAIETAKLHGRLPAGYVLNRHFLPAPPAETTVSQLLEDALKQCEDADQALQTARRGLAMLRQALNGEGDDEARAQREGERQRFEAHRQAELARLAAKAGTMH